MSKTNSFTSQFSMDTMPTSEELNLLRANLNEYNQIFNRYNVSDTHTTPPSGFER